VTAPESGPFYPLNTVNAQAAGAQVAIPDAAAAPPERKGPSMCHQVNDAAAAVFAASLTEGWPL
jgi:hypothetical protein